MLAAVVLLARAAPVVAGPLDAFSNSPVLGGMPSSTAGPESEPGLEEYTHIFSTDVWDENRFWYTNRPNILNMPVSDNWDAMKLINTDRPDFTDVATVVGKGVTQIETGYTFNDYYDRVSRVETSTVPESLLRYGTSDRFEFRLKWANGYTETHTENIATGQSVTQQGLSDFTLGFKYIAIKQDNWIPLQTIVTRLGVPAGSVNYSANTIQPGISYIYNWQVRKWWFIRGSSGVDWLRTKDLTFNSTSPLPAYATGATSLSPDSSVQGFQSISNYIQISPRLGMFLEWYLLYHRGTSNDTPQHFHDYGLYYYITPNLQLDARIGQQISHDYNNWFSGAGVSTRF